MNDVIIKDVFDGTGIDLAIIDEGGELYSRLFVGVKSGTPATEIADICESAFRCHLDTRFADISVENMPELSWTAYDRHAASWLQARRQCP